MDAESGSTGHSADTNEAYPVHHTEDLLQPFFTDFSFLSIMTSLTTPFAHPHSPPSEESDLRLVLLGRKDTGKSVAANTILGGGFKFGKSTEECVKVCADVNGTTVTMVDTPGWEWYYPLNSTPNWVKRETLRSVFLLAPGPHVVLLVVRSCASVNDDYIKEIEAHLSPLGRHVWDHTMVLFTRGDELGLVSMQQRIQTSPGLQKLLQKCKNRYHVMENRTKGEGTQGKELIRKLKKMVEEKDERCKYLEMENEVLSELEVDRTRRARERRKRQRLMEAQAHRSSIKTALLSDNPQFSESDFDHPSSSKTTRRLPEIRLVLLGERETGKSTIGDAILGHRGLFRPGTVTEEATRQQADVDQRHVTVVDTPGWEEGVMGSTPERVKKEIATCVGLCPPGPHAFLLTLRVDTAARESQISKHFELLGDDIWSYTILLFTHLDQLREGVSIEKHIQKCGRDLQTLLQKCEGRYHVISNANGSQNAAQVAELLEKVEKMATINKCVAFSGLVQEVKSLSVQKNERNNQCLKELHERMLRQEAELKKLRDREIKSFRWFFERKKKSKTSGILKKQEEEDEEKSIDQNIEEMEERMRLMIEDKEQEVIDLHVEQGRITAELHQSRKEAEDAGLMLETKEKEVEELNEQIDELQLKMLDLKRIAIGCEQERLQHKEAFKEWENVVQTLQHNVKMAMSDCAEWRDKAGDVYKDLEAAKRLHEEEVGEMKQENEIALKNVQDKMVEVEMLLNEKKQEVDQYRQIAEGEKQNALDSIERMRRILQKEKDEMTCQHKKELDEVMRRLNTEIQDKSNEMDYKLEMVRVEHFEEIENILKKHQNEMNEKMSETISLKEQLGNEAKTSVEIQQRVLADMEQKYHDILKEKSQEFDDAMQMIKESHKQEICEKDEDISVLRKQIQDSMTRQEAEIFKIKEEKENEMAIMQMRHEEELKGKLFGYEKHITEKDTEIQEVKRKCMDVIDYKNQEIKKKVNEKKDEIENLVTVNEDLKRKEKGDLKSMVDVQEKLQEREQEILKLKVCLKEDENKLRELETEKEQELRWIEKKLVEKDQLIQALIEKLKVTEEMLREKDEERGHVLLTQKKATELHLEFQNKAAMDMKQQLSKEIEKNAESVELVAKLTNNISQAQNKLMLKEEENILAVKSNVEEIAKLKKCLKNCEGIEEDWRCKEKEMEDKLSEKDKDLDQMRLIIEQTKAELNELTHKMDREMTDLIREYERGIETINQELRTVVAKKNEDIKCLEREKQKELLEVMEQFESSQRKVEEIEGKMVDEIQKLEIKCQALKEHCQEKDRQLNVKELEFDKMCMNYKQVVLELEQINTRLQKEKEEMKKQFEELGQQEVQKLKNHLEQKCTVIEILEKEKQEFEENMANFESKQEELVQWEVALTTKQSEVDAGQKCIKQKEKEFENLLQILEAKQKELHFNGQELQKKVKGLRDQGRELKDREFSLKSQEQELIDWTSQLNAKNENVNFTTQQLDEMGRELSSLKLELQHKDQKYRLMFDNLNKWEISLRERETELSAKQQQFDYTHKEDGIEFMHQDTSTKDRPQKMVELACPKPKSCHFATLQELNECPEMHNKQDVGSTEVINDFKGGLKRPNNDKEKSDLAILVLREAWSARSPSGLSILGGNEEEMSQMSGHNCTSWRGEIEGRQVSIVEPRGLKWQDCSNTSRENIRDALSLCEPEPNVVLLVLPVFLNCTESSRKAIENIVNLVTCDVWERTLVVFTWGETLGTNIEQHIERNREVRKLIEKCEGRYSVLTSKKNNSSIAKVFDKMNDIVARNKRGVWERL